MLFMLLFFFEATWISFLDLILGDFNSTFTFPICKLSFSERLKVPDWFWSSYVYTGFDAAFETETFGEELI